MKVLLTPLNNLVLVREFLWANPIKLDGMNGYEIKVGYNDGGPMYLAQSDDTNVRFYLFDQAAVDQCDDLGEL